ncbi:MAG: YgiQ family radical SAM protein [Calditrichaceae bacterium]|nr:YgiQ family radical SAM protein [Calditrichaceae bacterium]
MDINERKITDWIPTTRKEVEQLGWDSLDIILISGDAYVDHPAFGSAVIARIIQKAGYHVAIIPQPNWQDDLRDFKKLGKPNLFFGVTAGCMDSMVNHYTANKRRRSTDAYTPGNVSGFRPDYATITYSKILKKLYPETPIIIGGIEASLRRVTHYDYWTDRLMPSILVDSKADLLVYGMGEKPLGEILRLLDKGISIESMNTIPQTAFLVDKNRPLPKVKKWKTIELYAHEECIEDKIKYAKNFKHIERESNKQFANRLIQTCGVKKVIINPPFQKMTEKEIDASFDLPYTRMPHPKYAKRGTIPAYEMIRHSVNMHRGCFGGCSFCTISAHQGKMIASRSKQSIMNEVENITRMPDFKGYISDLGGPSANMYQMKGKDQSICDKCASPSCIYPTICYNLNTSHEAMLDIYQSVQNHPKVKKAFVTSGIRYDLLLKRPGNQKTGCSHQKYLEQLIRNHVSGRLKVAPEHTSDDVLRIMRKPSFKCFYEFKIKFDQISKKAGLNQQIIPYFISSHPGSTLENMANLACETKELGFRLEQVQDFTPTPMTLSTVMYYSELNPYTLKPVFTAKTRSEKQDQNRFFFWYKKDIQPWIIKTLNRLNRPDLLGKLLSIK